AGVTVFVTTHFLEEVEYCDWVCFIDAGRLIANAHPEEIRRRYSDGYRVAVALPSAARAGAAARVAAHPVTVTPTTDGLEVRAAALPPALLGELRTLAGEDAAITITRPEMTDVFRRLLAAATRGEVLAAPPPSATEAPAAPPAASVED